MDRNTLNESENNIINSKKISPKKVDLLLEVFNVLTDINLFSELDREDLLHFAHIVRKQKVKKNGIIASEGDKKKSNYYILSEGIIEISKKTALGEPYVISIRDTETMGRTSFGEVSLIYKSERTATITAKTDVVLYTINGDVFSNFCDDNPLIGYKIMKILARDICKYLRSSNEQTLILFNALVEETKKSIEL